MSNSPFADILTHVIKHPANKRALMIFDRRCLLASQLADGYQSALPTMVAIDFDQSTPDAIMEQVDALAADDLVILVQSSSFRLNQFRFRVELFKRGLAVIEHPHLERMKPEEATIYIEGLAYDPDYYQTIGRGLKQRIDVAKRIVVACDGTELVYETDFEDTKLNIGDYTGMKNRGGQFPIGEVFTEPKNFAGVNGRVKLFAFGDDRFHVNLPEKPITLVIIEGIITEVFDAPATFQAVLDQIQADEPLMIRELGFGMNRAFRKDRIVSDIGSYERMCGIHLSLGLKHAMYNKPGISKRKSRYHVDVFVDVKTVHIDDTTVYRDGSYQLPIQY